MTPKPGQDVLADIRLRLLGTTDVHANLRGYDYYTDSGDQPYGLTRVASLIQRARAQEQNTVLLENGDFLQGTPLSDITAKPGADWQGIHPVIAAMNLLRYDAAGLGNHEFNFGLDWLKKVLAGADFPVTCGNVLTEPATDRTAAQTLLQPFLILPTEVTDTQNRTQTLNIGLLSLVPPQITVWDQFHLQGQIWSRSIVEAARDLIPQMRASGADIVVIMAHSGIDTGPYHPMMENALVTLCALPGIDAIIAGHTHKVFPGPGYDDLTDEIFEKGHINGKPVVMAGFRGSHLGVIDLDLQKGSDGWQVIRSRSDTWPVSSAEELVPEAMDMVELLEPAHQATVVLTRKPLGKTNRPLHSYLSLIGDCRTVQVVTRAQAMAARQLAIDPGHEDLPLLSASAPFRSGGHGGPEHYCDIPSGQLFLRHAADLYPFPNLMCLARITGADLREWLERSATLFNTIHQGAGLQKLVNPKVPHHAFDIIDGITYRIDLTKEALFSHRGTAINSGQAGRISELRLQGRPVDDSDHFLIATNNYRVFGGGPHRGIDPAKVLYTAQTPIVDLVSDYIQTAQPDLVPDQDIWEFESIANAEVSFSTGPGLFDHPDDMAARQLRHVHRDRNGFEHFAMTL